MFCCAIFQFYPIRNSCFCLFSRRFHSLSPLYVALNSSFALINCSSNWKSCYIIHNRAKRKKPRQKKYIVDYIGDKRVTASGLVQYKIFWQGHLEPTWEPTRIIEDDCPELASCYERNILALLNQLQAESVAIQRTAGQFMRRMYAECQELSAKCRSQDSKLAKMMKNKNMVADFECFLCKNKYGRRDRIVRHIRNNHVNGKPRYECKICGRSYSCKSNLNRHKCAPQQV